MRRQVRLVPPFLEPFRLLSDRSVHAVHTPKSQHLPTTPAAASSDEADLQFSAAMSSVRFRSTMKYRLGSSTARIAASHTLSLHV